jgi:hypothetical protein
MVAEAVHDAPAKAGELGGDAAQAFLQLDRLPLRAHPAYLAEVQQDVAQDAQRRRRLVLLPVPQRRLFPLVQHGRRHRRADQRVVHPASDMVDGAQELAVQRYARTGKKLQKCPAKHDVLLSRFRGNRAGGAIQAR